MTVKYSSVLEATGKAKPPMGYKGAINAMESVIEPDETIIYGSTGNAKLFNTMTSEMIGDYDFICTCITDQRVLLTGLTEMAFSTSEIESVHVGTSNVNFGISSISTGKESLGLVMAGNQTIHLPIKDGERANIAIAALNEMIEKRADTNNNAPIAGQSDPTEQLRKFKQLETDGIITADEFEAKKKELLGL